MKIITATATIPSTRVDAKRSAGKPNSRRMLAIRYSLAGRECMTCGLSVCWSSAYRVAGCDVPAFRAEFGHVIGSSIGGTWSAGNVGAQCHACNQAGRDADVLDLTGMIIPGSVPATYVPQRIADARADVRDVAPMVEGHTAEDARRARARRGLTW